MTKKERLLQDIQYAIDHKIDRFYMKTEPRDCKGLTLTINPFCNFEKLKEEVSVYCDNNLFVISTDKNEISYYRIVSWGEFSIHEDKYIKQVVLGNELGEDIYD